MSAECCNVPCRFFLYTVVLLLAFSVTIPSIACVTEFSIQDETTVSDDSDLGSLLQQWKDLEAELIKKEAEFKTADAPEKQLDIKGQYTSLVAEANELVAKIKTGTMKAFEANPGDEKTARLAVGILKNDAESGRDNDAIKLGDQLIAGGVDGTLFETAAKSSNISITTRELLEELFIRYNQSKMDTLPQVRIVTSKGELVVELFEEEAPNTVANFVSLAEDKFYDGLKFHRVIEGFAAQGGDPKGDGSGGPGYSIACECAEVEARRHFLGSLSMAHAGKDSGGSQFFLCLSRTSDLNERHTVFGRVINGIEVLDNLTRNYTPSAPISGSDSDVIEKMEVIRKRDHEYKPKKIGEEESEDDAPEPPPVQPKTLDIDDDGNDKEEPDVEKEADSEEADSATEESESDGG